MAPAAVDKLLDATGQARVPPPRRPPARARRSSSRAGRCRTCAARSPARRSAGSWPTARAGVGAAAPPPRRGRTCARCRGAAPVAPAGLAPVVPEAVRRRDGRPLPARQIRRALQGRGGDGRRCAPGRSTRARRRRCSTARRSPSTRPSSRRRAPPGVRFAELPGYLGDRGAARALEKAIKDRLPGELAGVVWTDPVTRATSQPGEDREAFAARLGQGAGAAAPQVARLRDRLEKKKRDLEARQRDLEGRRTEKWVALGSAVLSNVGLLHRPQADDLRRGHASSPRTAWRARPRRGWRRSRRRSRTSSRSWPPTARVDPRASSPRRWCPTRTQVKLLRYGIVWVY